MNPSAVAKTRDGTTSGHAPHWNRLDPGEKKFGQPLYLQVHHGFELRAIDALAFAGGFARIESGEHPFTGDHCREKVREDETEFFTLAARRAGYAGQT